MSLIADSLKNALKDKSGKNKYIPEINLLGTSRKLEPSGLRKVIPLIVIPGAVLLYLIYEGAFDKRRTTLTQLPIWRSLGMLMKEKPPPVTAPLPVEGKTLPQPVLPPAVPSAKETETLPDRAGLALPLQAKPELVEQEPESVAVIEPAKKPVPPPSIPATPMPLPQSKLVPENPGMDKVEEIEAIYAPTPLASRAQARPKETKPKPKATAFRKAEPEAAPKKSQPARPLPSPAAAKQVPIPEIFKTSEYYFNQAIFFQQAVDLEKALESYRKAAEFSKNDNPEIYNNMGVIYKDLGKYDEAIEAFTRTVYLDPNYAKAYNNLGVVYYLKKNYVGAVASYEKAIAIKPKNVEAYNNLAVAYKKMQQPETAKNVLNKALAIDANHAGTSYNLALLHEEEGAAKAALHFYRRFLEFDGTSHPELAAEVKEHIKSLQ